jgi:mRNA interferase MazF
MASVELPLPRRGDIWLVALGAGRRGEPGKTRPAIVLSVEEVLSGAADELVVVVPVSSSRAPSALRPVISAREGIDADSAAISRAVRAVTLSRLVRHIGGVEPGTLREIERAVALILGLDSSSSKIT